MAKHSLDARSIADSPVANAIEGYASAYIAQQSWFKRHKNVILSVAQGVLQALNILLTILSGGAYPVGVTIAVALALSVAQVLVVAATAAPVTESNTANLVRFVDAVQPKSSIRDYYAAAKE